MRETAVRVIPWVRACACDRYRGMSYLRVAWISAEEIEALSARGRQALTKYLNALSKLLPHQVRLPGLRMFVCA